MLCVVEIVNIPRFKGLWNEGMGWLRDGSIPLLFKEGWLRLNKKIPFLSGADGVVCNFKQNKDRYAGNIRRLRDFLLTIPAAARPPLL